MLSAATKNVSNTVLVYSGLGGIACGTLLMAAAPHVVTTIFGCLLIGFAAGGIIVPVQALIQEETPPAMLGRVGVHGDIDYLWRADCGSDSVRHSCSTYKRPWRLRALYGNDVLADLGRKSLAVAPVARRPREHFNFVRLSTGAILRSRRFRHT